MSNYLPVLLVSLNTAPDDSSFQPLPRGQVDYLSHVWDEEDVWRSWRNMTKQKNEIVNGPRLENASWRTWWKQRNKLKTVSPETLNWLKDSDVTWLYGPLHTAEDMWAHPGKASLSPSPSSSLSPPPSHSPSPSLGHATAQPNGQLDVGQPNSALRGKMISSPSSNVELSSHGQQPSSSYGQHPQQYANGGPLPYPSQNGAYPHHQSELRCKPILKHRSIAELLTSALSIPSASSGGELRGRTTSVKGAVSNGQSRGSRQGHDARRGGEVQSDSDSGYSSSSAAVVVPVRPSLQHTKSDSHVLRRFGHNRGAGPFQLKDDAASDTDAIQELEEEDEQYEYSEPPTDMSDDAGSSQRPIVISNGSSVTRIPSTSSLSASSSYLHLPLQNSSTANFTGQPSHPAIASAPTKKHISFNAIVEQCIAIDKPKSQKRQRVEGSARYGYGRYGQGYGYGYSQGYGLGVEEEEEDQDYRNEDVPYMADEAMAADLEYGDNALHAGKQHHAQHPPNEQYNYPHAAPDGPEFVHTNPRSSRAFGSRRSEDEDEEDEEEDDRLEINPNLSRRSSASLNRSSLSSQPGGWNKNRTSGGGIMKRTSSAASSSGSSRSSSVSGHYASSSSGSSDEGASHSSHPAASQPTAISVTAPSPPISPHTISPRGTSLLTATAPPSLRHGSSSPQSPSPNSTSPESSSAPLPGQVVKESGRSVDGGRVFNHYSSNPSSVCDYASLAARWGVSIDEDKDKAEDEANDDNDGLTIRPRRSSRSNSGSRNSSVSRTGNDLVGDQSMVEEVHGSTSASVEPTKYETEAVLAEDPAYTQDFTHSHAQPNAYNQSNHYQYPYSLSLSHPEHVTIAPIAPTVLKLGADDDEEELAGLDLTGLSLGLTGLSISIGRGYDVDAGQNTIANPSGAVVNAGYGGNSGMGQSSELALGYGDRQIVVEDDDMDPTSPDDNDVIPYGARSFGGRYQASDAKDAVTAQSVVLPYDVVIPGTLSVSASPLSTSPNNGSYFSTNSPTQKQINAAARMADQPQTSSYFPSSPTRAPPSPSSACNPRVATLRSQGQFDGRTITSPSPPLSPQREEPGNRAVILPSLHAYPTPSPSSASSDHPDYIDLPEGGDVPGSPMDSPISVFDTSPLLNDSGASEVQVPQQYYHGFRRGSGLLSPASISPSPGRDEDVQRGRDRHAGRDAEERGRGRTLRTPPTSTSPSSRHPSTGSPSSISRSSSGSWSRGRGGSAGGGRGRTRAAVYDRDPSTSSSSPEIEKEPERGRSRSRGSSVSLHPGSSASPLSSTDSALSGSPRYGIIDVMRGSHDRGRDGDAERDRDIRLSDRERAKLFRKTSEDFIGRGRERERKSLGSVREGGAGPGLPSSLSPPSVSVSAYGRSYGNPRTSAAAQVTRGRSTRTSAICGATVSLPGSRVPSKTNLSASAQGRTEQTSPSPLRQSSIALPSGDESDNEGRKWTSSPEHSPAKELVSSLSSDASGSTIHMSGTPQRTPSGPQGTPEISEKGTSKSQHSADKLSNPGSGESKSASGSRPPISVSRPTTALAIASPVRPTHSPKSSASYSRPSHSRTDSNSSATKRPLAYVPDASDDRISGVHSQSHNTPSPNGNLVGRAVDMVSSGARGFIGAIWGQ